MAAVTKRRLSRHALAVLAVFLLVAFLLRMPIQLLLKSRDEYAIDPEFAPPPSPPSDGPDEPHAAHPQTQLQPHPQRIPKVVHQVYNMWSTGPIPDDWAANRKSCIDMHPDYEFKLWDKNSARDLIATQYPWFLETFDNYRYPIQRADSIRYFILLTYGGIYLDMDVGCVRRLDPLLKYPAFMSAAPTQGLTNSIMGSMPGHAYFANLVDSLMSYDINWLLPYLTIMNASGTHFVSFVWMDHLAKMAAKATPSEGDDLDKLYILMPSGRSGGEGSFFYNGRGKSWHNWDNYAFVFVDTHPLITASLFLPSIGILYSVVWCLWTVLAARSKRMAFERSEMSEKNLYMA